MKAVEKHVEEKWIKLYIGRWLTAPMQQADGTQIARNCGTPQGGVISPLLSNLFLHYVFDSFMQRTYPERKWCRYADDGLIHCRTRAEAEQMLAALTQRFAECGLTLHPNKTRIIYCKDGNRRGNVPYEKSFDFLGYTFRGRTCKNAKQNCLFTSFTPAVSRAAQKSMRSQIRKSNVRNHTELNLNEIAAKYNPFLTGWINYYGRYTRSAMYPVLRHFNQTLVALARKKYRHLGGRKTRASKWLRKIAQEQTTLFVHWYIGMVSTFA